MLFWSGRTRQLLLRIYTASLMGASTLWFQYERSQIQQRNPSHFLTNPCEGSILLPVGHRPVQFSFPPFSPFSRTHLLAMQKRRVIEVVWLIDLLQLLETTMRHMPLLPLLLLPTLFSCDTTDPPPPHQPSIQLSAEDVSCTEAWLKVSLTDANEPRTIAIQQDGHRVLTVRLVTTDSLLVVAGLLPRRSYTFLAQRLGDSTTIDASTPAQATTMDTSSHAFQFEIDTLGDGNSSVLYDVAIINDTLAYAVGEMYLRDSTGQLDPIRYNAAVWNGSTWNIIRVPYYYQGQPFYNPIQTVYAFAPNDIWFAGNGVIRWNGQQYIPVAIPPSVWGPNRINKIWGNSSNSLYIVGDGGSIAYYANGSWQHVESGTTLHVYDVSGGANASIDNAVIGVAAQLFANLYHRILSLSPTPVIALPDSGIRGSLHSVWFISGRKYYVVGDGMYSKYSSTSSAPWVALHPGLTQYYTYVIDGPAFNDIVVCGSFGEFLHFNGFSWRSFRETTGISMGAYYEAAIKGSLCIAVGYESPCAIVAIGRR
jgi:hypothetical protein